jgi:hypothetical protein
MRFPYVGGGARDNVLCIVLNQDPADNPRNTALARCRIILDHGAQWARQFQTNLLVKSLHDRRIARPRIISNAI